MGNNQPVDQLISEVCHLDRSACIAELRHFRDPDLDFTDQYLSGQSDEQLRHILLAACLQARKHRPHLAG